MVPRKCYKIQAISESWRPTAFVASSVVPGAAETVGVSHYHQDRIWMPEPNKSARREISVLFPGTVTTQHFISNVEAPLTVFPPT